MAEDVPGLDFIEMLRPVSYNLDLHAIDNFWAGRLGIRDLSLNHTGYEKESIKYSGFLAQEVLEAAADVGYDFSGVDIPKNENGLFGLRYATFVVPLVKAVQELSDQNEVQKQTILELKEQLNMQEQLMLVILNRLDGLETKEFNTNNNQSSSIY